MSTFCEHVWVLDRFQNYLYSTDGARIYLTKSEQEKLDYVEVKKINGRLGNQFYPCNKCIFRNVLKHKLLFGNQTHAIYMRWKSFNHNVNSGQGQPYTEMIGRCNSFVQDRGALEHGVNPFGR